MSPWTRIAAASTALAVLVATGSCQRASSRMPQHPNLLLMTVDTLRADHVGAYGSTAGTTPALDALAAAGGRFDQGQTAVPLTGPSHPPIPPGQDPPAPGVPGNVGFSPGPE